MDITLGNRSEATGRFNFVIAKGDVSLDDTEAHAVMTSVIERRGGYWADDTHGSLLFQLKSLTSRTPSQAEAMVLDALSSLERSGAIKNVVVTAVPGRNPVGGGTLQVNVSWTTPAGTTQARTITI